MLKTLVAFAMIGAKRAFKSMIKNPDFFNAVALAVEDACIEAYKELAKTDLDFLWLPTPNFGGFCIRRYKNCSKAEAEKIGIEMLAQVGIPTPEARMKQYPHEFSGGMRQRALIAMALSCEPSLLIADEPTTALDVTIQAQILELLKKLHDERNMSIVIISHDMGVMANMCDRIAVMYGGIIVEEGTVDEIFYSPKHPYTKALLKSIPHPEHPKGEKLVGIDGAPPSLYQLPKGCPFAERCEYATEKCMEEIPEFEIYSETHKAKCFYDMTEGKVE